MTNTAGHRIRGAVVQPRLLILLAVLLLGTGLIAANVRFVKLAFDSQPECVQHVQSGDAKQGVYRAAKSACQPVAGRDTTVSGAARRDTGIVDSIDH